MSEEALSSELKKLEKLRASSKGQLTNALADVLTNVGGLYQEKCEFDKALQHHYESLSIRRQIYKENQIQYSIANTLTNIAVTYSKMKDLNLALKYNLEALEMQKVLIKGIHPCIATTVSNIGVVYDKMG